jgi:hypothetical protein
MSKETREATARQGIGVALLLALFGCFATFAPPGETLWFGTAAVPAVFGLRSSRWWVKAVAVVLVVLLMSPVWFGYQRGSWR